MAATACRKYRPLKFGVTRVTLREGAAGVRYLQAEQPLGEHALRMTDRLVHWAAGGARAHLHGAPRPGTPTAAPATGGT